MASSENLAVTVDGVTVEVSNPDKPLFGGESTTGDSRITKGDLARYYAAIGPTMLPHVRGRPMTLVRYPNGLGGDSFFQKHTPKHYPDWIPRVELKKKGGVIHHSVVDHPAALVYFAQQNVITLHIGLARLPHLDTPDVFVVDLDPSTDDLDQVRRVALGVKDAFERAGLAPFVQLTGSKGLHIVAPLAAGPGATWANAQSFGRAVSTVLLNRFPDDLTMEFSKSERGDRIYLDMGRNNYPATFAAPYAVRAFPEAPVVTPVGWDELEDPAFHPRRYTIATVFDRLREHGDPWAGMAEAARPLPA